jgi:hypothetical protein
MTPMMLTYRAAEIPAEQESNHGHTSSLRRRHHHHAQARLEQREISEDSAQLSSSGEEIVENLRSTFAEHLHSEAVDREAAHGERR